MDTISHIAIGACLGEKIAPKNMGKHALLWGALAQNFPDIDALTSLGDKTSKVLYDHRGISHSFFTAFIASIVFAFLLSYLYRKKRIKPFYFFIFFFVQISVHLLLDTCNAYGTGLLEPFSHQRFSFNILYVVDPLFTIVPLVAFIFLWLKKVYTPQRKKWVALGIIWPLCYISLATFNKTIIDKKTRADMHAQSLPVKDFFITPTPFNSLLWYIVVKTDFGYAVAYHSVLDKEEAVPYTIFQQNDSLLKNDVDPEDIHYLKKFANGYYTISKTNDTLEFNVIRFGQVLGWLHPDAPFALHYYLMKNADNTVAVQRGRFQGWNKAAIYATWKRMWGTKNP